MNILQYMTVDSFPGACFVTEPAPSATFSELSFDFSEPEESPSILSLQCESPSGNNGSKSKNSEKKQGEQERKLNLRGDGNFRV